MPKVWGGWRFLFVVWVVFAFMLVYIASIDLYDHEQFILGVSALGLILVLRARYMGTLHKSRPLRFTRLLLMILAGVLALRYLIWRVQFSIPWHDDTLSLILSLLLLLAEVFSIALYFLGAFTVVHPLWREPVPIDLEQDDLPTVDVFIPSYNEPPSLLQTTLLAATNMHYPPDKLRVYLLDDGGTDAKCAQPGEAGERARRRKEELRAMCRSIGVSYLTRKDNSHAKAGNINAALKKTHGEIIVILDSDHVPTMNFLKLTIGTFLKDPNVVLVQTPHHMINQDPLEKSLKASRHMPSEGDMFYSLSLRGMDNWNAGFFCGSGALLKRSALEEIGGLCTDTIVEDADSSMEMLTRGHRMAYLHIPVLAGLNSESLEALVVQRSRWATGMIQLLRMKNPLFRKGLTFAQRLAYFNCIAYWLFVLARVVFLFTPICALVLGATFFAAPPSEILLYLIPYLVGLYLVLNVMYGRVRWTFVSDIYDTFSAVLLAGPVLRALFGLEDKRFHVTPKQVVHSETWLSPLAYRFYGLLALQIAASAYGLFVLWHDASMYNQIVVSLAWNVYNMIFVLAALGTMIERGEVRHRPRIAVDEIASLKVGDRHIPCHISDMTEYGAQIRIPGWTGSLPENTRAWLKFSAEQKSKEVSAALDFASEVPICIRNMRRARFRSQEAVVLGVSFEFENIEQRRMVIGYLYGDSRRWQFDLREKHRHSTILQGVMFLFRSLGYGLLHVWMLLRLLLQRLGDPFRRKTMAVEGGTE